MIKFWKKKSVIPPEGSIGRPYIIYNVCDKPNVYGLHIAYCDYLCGRTTYDIRLKLSNLSKSLCIFVNCSLQITCEPGSHLTVDYAYFFSDWKVAHACCWPSCSFTTAVCIKMFIFQVWYHTEISDCKVTMPLNSFPLMIHIEWTWNAAWHYVNLHKL